MHKDDVVEITDRPAVPPRVGYMEELDDDWGVAIVWRDGSRTWYSLDHWCPENEAAGFKIRLADKAQYVKTADFKLAAPEVGRGWLRKPPERAQPETIFGRGIKKARRADVTAGGSVEGDLAVLCVVVDEL